MLPDLHVSNLKIIITKLQSYKNRYTNSITGVRSSHYIFNAFKYYLTKFNISSNIAEVEYFKHKYWKQPSVIATIYGNELKQEIIILGAHEDSVNDKNSEEEETRAPGADDNASGTAILIDV